MNIEAPQQPGNEQTQAAEPMFARYRRLKKELYEEGDQAEIAKEELVGDYQAMRIDLGIIEYFKTLSVEQFKEFHVEIIDKEASIGNLPDFSNKAAEVFVKKLKDYFASEVAGQKKVLALDLIAFIKGPRGV